LGSNDSMVVENTVEAAVDPVIDVVHEASVTQVSDHLTNGMDLSQKCKGGSDLKQIKVSSWNLCMLWG
jgi:PKD repeat protein